MSVRIPVAPITLDGRLDTGVLTTPRVVVDPLTEAITIRLPRTWGPDTTLRVTLCMVVDGEEYKAIGQSTGGVRFWPDGRVVETYRLR